MRSGGGCRARRGRTRLRRSTTASPPATGRRTAPARARACRGSGAPPRGRTGRAGTSRAPAAGSRQRARRDGRQRPRGRSMPPTLVNRRPSRSNNSCPRWNGFNEYVLVVITSAPAATYDSCTRRTYSGSSINACADHSGWLNGAPIRASSRPGPAVEHRHTTHRGTVPRRALPLLERSGVSDTT